MLNKWKLIHQHLDGCLLKKEGYMNKFIYRKIVICTASISLISTFVLAAPNLAELVNNISKSNISRSAELATLFSYDKVANELTRIETETYQGLNNIINNSVKKMKLKSMNNNQPQSENLYLNLNKDNVIAESYFKIPSTEKQIGLRDFYLEEKNPILKFTQFANQHVPNMISTLKEIQNGSLSKEALNKMVEEIDDVYFNPIITIVEDEPTLTTITSIDFSGQDIISIRKLMLKIYQVFNPEVK